MAISKTSKILLIIGGVLLLFFVIGVVAIIAILSSVGKPSIATNSVLSLNISGELPDL